METKFCGLCEQTRPVEDFNWKAKSRGIRQSNCRKCTKSQLRSHYKDNTSYYKKKAKARDRANRSANREHLVRYLSEHPCVDCGEERLPTLQFDHVRGQKKFNISAMIRHHNWDGILQEIVKCEVRCANCHAVKTATQFGYWNALEN